MSKPTSLAGTRVLDKGEIRLLNQMGGDKSVVAAARVSNGVSYEEASKGPESDQKLINYLVKHRHGTPFEHATFQFYVKAPLFVRSEWHRHRMASYNEISGRYVEYEPEFYFPQDFRIPGTTNKQGSIVPGPDYFRDNVGFWSFNRGPDGVQSDRLYWNGVVLNLFVKQTMEAYKIYQTLISQGVAKEMARMILPLNLYTQFYVTINARSLMNFLSLRTAQDAQWEIRQYALVMENMFHEAMPFTYNAWEENNFIAP